MSTLRYIGPLVLVAIVLGIAACSDRNIPVTVSTHPDGWASPQSDEFHGTFVNESAAKGENCATCHGEDLMGGTSGVSCFECHSVYPHPDNFTTPGNANFHGKMIAQVVNWDLSVCQECHGSDYDGNGLEEKSCRTPLCHPAADGPEDCQTCHGGEFNAAPPEDLSGHSDPMFHGVGAHQAHLQASELWTGNERLCQNCHVMPATYDAPGHIDSNAPEAEVVFGALATHNGTLTPDYDEASATCSGTYCHGGFVFTLAETQNPRGYAEDQIEGNNVTVDWTQPETGQAECGTCHGIPPTGHIDATPDICYRCHVKVVDPDLNIINPSLHINGEINVFSTSIVRVGAGSN